MKSVMNIYQKADLRQTDVSLIIANIFAGFSCFHGVTHKTVSASLDRPCHSLVQGPILLKRHTHFAGHLTNDSDRCAGFGWNYTTDITLYCCICTWTRRKSKIINFHKLMHNRNSVRIQMFQMFPFRKNPQLSSQLPSLWSLSYN